MKKQGRLFSVILACVFAIICTAPAVQAAQDTNIKASVMVIGDSRHASGEHSQYQVWVEKTSYSLAKGAKAADLIFMALSAKGIDYEYTKAPVVGAYITSISAPDILGGHPLSDGSGKNGNTANAGWMISTNKAGYQELLSAGIGQYVLSDGEFIVVRYIDDYNDIDWTNPRLPASWLSAAPLPSKEYTFADFSKLTGTDTYQLTVEKNSVIRAEALAGLPKGSVLYADTKAGNRVSFRIKLPLPHNIKGDLKAGVCFAPETNAVYKLFSGHFTNRLQVLAFDYASQWGQTAEIMVYSGEINGFDINTWKLYSYDPAGNLYTKIPYSVDKNEYIHFFTGNANPVIFSDGELAKK